MNQVIVRQDILNKVRFDQDICNIDKVFNSFNSNSLQDFNEKYNRNFPEDINFYDKILSKQQIKDIKGTQIASPIINNSCQLGKVGSNSDSASDQTKQYIQTQHKSNQNVWQKRYRQKQRGRMQELEDEIKDLNKQLHIMQFDNSGLKDGKKSTETYLQQRNEEIVHNMIENHNLDPQEMNSLIFTPTGGIITIQVLHLYSWEELKSLYLEYADYFKEQLAIIDQSKDKYTGKKGLQKYTESFNILMTTIKYEKISNYHKLLCYNFEENRLEQPVLQIEMARCKHLADKLNFNEDEQYEAFIAGKMLISGQYYKRVMLRKQFDAFLKEFDNAKCEPYQKDRHESITFLNEYIKFKDEYQDLKNQSKRDQVFYIQKWLEPQQLALIVKESYPNVPCMLALQFYYVKLYLEKQGEIFQDF